MCAPDIGTNKGVSIKNKPIPKHTMAIFKISQGIYRPVPDSSHPIIYAYNVSQWTKRVYIWK